MAKYNLGAVQQGITKTVLWSGNLNTENTTIQLNDSVKNYKFIYLYFESYGTNNRNATTFIIDTDDINNTNGSNAFLSTVSPDSSEHRYFGFNFTNGYDKITSFNILNSNGGDFSLKRVVGIN